MKQDAVLDGVVPMRFLFGLFENSCKERISVIEIGERVKPQNGRVHRGE